MEGIELTEAAAKKFLEIAEENGKAGAHLRLSVVGGGCSGFSYSMNFDTNPPEENDKVFEFFGVKVYVDQASFMYLKGTKVDWVEALDGAGFKFENPNVKTTCGCGSSFSA